MKTYSKSNNRVLSFWTIEDGDPIKIRDTHPDKNLHNIVGEAIGHSDFTNGFGIVFTVAIVQLGKKRRFIRVSSEHLKLLPVGKINA